MTNFRNVLNTALNQDYQAQRKDSLHAAMNHWFSRNRGVQHTSWQVTYEPTYHIENIQRPNGIAETYWDTLSQAEKRWTDSPVKNQNLIDRRTICETQTGLMALPEAKRENLDFYSKARDPGAPFEEAYRAPAKLSSHLQTVSEEPLFESEDAIDDDSLDEEVIDEEAIDDEAIDENLTDSKVIARKLHELLADKRRPQLDLVSNVGKYPEKKTGLLLQLQAIHSKWKQAGNW